LAQAEKVNEGGTTEAWPFVLLWMKGLFIFTAENIQGYEAVKKA